MVALTIIGAPRTKKNHSQIIRVRGRPMVIPSKEYQAWLAAAEHANPQLANPHERQAIDYPVNCAAVFYRDRRVGDAVGYYQGLADLLQHFGVVTNDKYIVQWDGSRMTVDRDNPRVELTLTAVVAQESAA